MKKIVAACVTIMLLASTDAAGAAERHAGYYYPPPGSTEPYTARTITIADADRKMRLGFIIGITRNMLSRPYAPGLVIFAKGEPRS